MTTTNPTTNDRPALGLPGLESAIKARGYRSISGFALAIGEPAAPLYDAARGRTNPTAPTIVRLARALQCTTDELLLGAPGNVGDLTPADDANA